MALILGRPLAASRLVEFAGRLAFWVLGMKRKRTIATLRAAKEDAETRKQWAFDHQAEIYAERDLLVAVLARQWPSHIMQHEHSPASHKAVVCIHTPFGQLTWSVPQDVLDRLYRGLCEWGENDYRRDPCKTAEKRTRLDRYALSTPCVFPPDTKRISK